MASSSGTRIYANNTWNPRLLVHEIIHVWSGKYKFASNQNWQWDNRLSGFEEIAEGIAYEILHDFIKAYPNDPESIIILKGGAWNEWSGRFSNYDLIKHQRWTEGGDFWVGPLTSNDRYNISSVLMQIFMKDDEDFYRKIYTRFYETIESDPNFFPTRENIIELWSSVVPTLNGIPTKHYLEAMPILNCSKLKPELYAIALPDGRLSNGGKQKLFCVFPDNQKGEFWWSSSIYDSNIEQYGIPAWFGKFKGSDNFYYTDNRKQPYTVKVKNSMGILLSTIQGELNNPTRSTDGGPSTIATSTPSALYGKNYEIGLYKMTLEFPNYKNFSEDYSEDSYFFGYHNFKQDKNTGRTVMVGIDCLSETSNAEMILNGKSYSTKMKNGCAIFEIEALNEQGLAKINIHSEDRNRTNAYQRAIIIGGTADGYRHQPILIIDKDFDGNEDLYEGYQEVIAFKKNKAEEITTTISPENNQSEFQSSKEGNSILISSSTSSEFNKFDLNISWIQGGIKITWNEPLDSSYYLELLNNKIQLIYGGHPINHAVIYLAEHNLTGTESIQGRFLRYKNSQFVDYFENFTINLKDFEASETIDLLSEVANSDSIGDGAINIGIAESNASDVNEQDGTLEIQVTLSIEESEETNSSTSTNDNEVGTTSNKLLLETGNETSYEDNSTSSTASIEENKNAIQKELGKGIEKTNNTRLEAPSLPPEINCAWDNAIYIQNDWYYLEWFGYFFKVPDCNWVYHETLGWFYTDWTTTFESIWLYHETLGWTWTNSNHFPYLLNNIETSWYYLIDFGYYDFSKDCWIEIH